MVPDSKALLSRLDSLIKKAFRSESFRVSVVHGDGTVVVKGRSDDGFSAQEVIDWLELHFNKLGIKAHRADPNDTRLTVGLLQLRRFL